MSDNHSIQLRKIQNGWNNAVDGLAEEFYQAGDVYGLYHFCAPRNLKPSWLGESACFPVGFSTTLTLEGQDLHAAFSRWQYCLQNPSLITPAEQPVQPELYVIGRDWNLRQNYYQQSDRPKLDAAVCLNLRFDERFLLLGRAGYLLDPVVTVGIGFRDKGTEEVKALFGIAHYEQTAELARWSYNNQRIVDRARPIIEKQVAELISILGVK